MIFDLHVHTVFCDGKNTPEETVLSAIEKGADEIGLVIHSYVPFCSTGTCKSIETENAFCREIARLKEKYRDKITVKCGIEMDYYSEHIPMGFDYVIGSVHFFKVGKDYYPIDKSAEDLRVSIEEGFSGDVYSAAEAYFKDVSDVVEKHGADIIGHFDLITKFNEKDGLFDENNPRYVKAWKSAVDRLIPYNVPFELNTGAIARGYRTTPYPSAQIIEYIKSKGGKLILSSDSHNADNLLFGFNEWKKFI